MYLNMEPILHVLRQVLAWVQVVPRCVTYDYITGGTAFLGPLDVEYRLPDHHIMGRFGVPYYREYDETSRYRELDYTHVQKNHLRKKNSN